MTRGLISVAAVLLALAGCNRGAGGDNLDSGVTIITGPDGGATGHHDGGIVHDGGQVIILDAGTVELTVTQLAPDRGPTAGGITVTVTGSGFLSGLAPSDTASAAAVTSLTFGGNAALNVLILSDSALQVASPAGAAGPADVVVTNPNGTTTCAGCFTFLSPIEVDQVTPPNGPAAGGTPVTVVGLGFNQGTRLLFGPHAALQTKIVSATEITALAPASTTPGAVEVRVFNANGSASLYDGYTYFGAPALSGVQPPDGPIAGGTAVTLIGSGFLGEQLSVSFGGGAASQIAVVDDTTVTLVTPPGAVGPATVVVSDSEGSAKLTGGFVYLDPSVASFSLFGLVPPSGPATGGNTVSIVGAGFSAGFGVSFGDAGPVAATPSSANLATAVVPASDPETVDVFADGGDGEALLLAGYTYLSARDVSQVVPSSGPSAGGTAIAVSGDGFLPGDSLFVGALAATGVVVVDGGLITAVTPEGSAGPASVTVIASDGGNPATLVNGFSFVDPFNLIQVNPTSGSQAGGTYVELLGTGFGLGDTASFAGAAASNLQLVDAYTLSCLTPSGTPGPADVTVMAAGDGGSATLSGGYSYFDPTNSSGGQSGGPLDGILNITVLSSSPYSYGSPVQGATVRLGLDPETPFQGTTDTHGQITFSDPTLVKPQMVTAEFDGTATTVDDVTQQDLTIFVDIDVAQGGGGVTLCPCSQNGAPPNCPDNCGLPFCGLVGYCVQCLSDSDCQNPNNPGYNPANPHCYPPAPIGGACVHCTSDSDCTDDPNGNLACDDQRGTESTFTCVQCTANSFCPSGDYCNTQNVTCQPSDLISGNVYGFKLPEGVTVPAGGAMVAHVGILQPAVYYFEPFSTDPTEYVVEEEGGAFAFQLDANALNLSLYAKFGVVDAAGNFTPYLLGIVRGVAVDPQAPATGVSIILDTHLDQVAPITLVNTLAPPPVVFGVGDAGVESSSNPVLYDVFAYLDLGQDGVMPLGDVLVCGTTDCSGTPSVNLTGLPPILGNGVLFLAQAFQLPTTNNGGSLPDPTQRSPTSDFFESVDSDFTAGVSMGPLLPFVSPILPATGGILTGTFQWSFGGSTPAVGAPDLTEIDLVDGEILDGQLLNQTSLWTIVVPGTQTEVQIPDDLLQQILSTIPQTSGLQNELVWQINTANEPRFDYAFFSYSDLGIESWTSFQTTNALASP